MFYDVILLNTNLETEYRCKTTDFLWHSKFLEPGEFQIEILVEDDLDLDVCKYVTVNTKKEIGILQKPHYSSDNPGTVILSGYFLEYLLYESVVYPTYSATNKTIWQIGNEACGTYLNNLGFSLVLPSQPSSGVIIHESLSVAVQQTGDYVGTLLYGQSSVFGYGVQITKADTGLQIDIANYHNRTGETDDEEKVFSVGLNSIKKYDVVKDDSNYRNVAVVAGEGEGSARVFEVVDKAEAGEQKRHLWVDARDLQQETDESIDDYRLKLRQRGLEKLAETVKIVNIEIEIEDDEAQQIGTEYDIGDIVTVVITPIVLL